MLGGCTSCCASEPRSPAVVAAAALQKRLVARFALEDDLLGGRRRRGGRRGSARLGRRRGQVGWDVVGARSSWCRPLLLSCRDGWRDCSAGDGRAAPAAAAGTAAHQVRRNCDQVGFRFNEREGWCTCVQSVLICRALWCVRRVSRQELARCESSPLLPRGAARDTHGGRTSIRPNGNQRACLGSLLCSKHVCTLDISDYTAASVMHLYPIRRTDQACAQTCGSPACRRGRADENELAVHDKRSQGRRTISQSIEQQRY